MRPRAIRRVVSGPAGSSRKTPQPSIRLPEPGSKIVTGSPKRLGAAARAPQSAAPATPGESDRRCASRSRRGSRPLEAVEAAPVLADLSQPWPDPLDPSRNRHRVGDFDSWLRNQLIPWQRPPLLFGRGSPAPHPRFRDELIAECCHCPSSVSGRSRRLRKRPEKERRRRQPPRPRPRLAAGRDDKRAQEKNRPHLSIHQLGSRHMPQIGGAPAPTRNSLVTSNPWRS